jgi:uncharacterized membrane protein YccF (DUF307 family)
MLKFIGNVLWLVLAGFWLAVGYVVAAVLSFITIIGIPFGVASMRLAGYVLWPFGRAVVDQPDRDAGVSLLGNVIWFVLGGWWLALAHLATALALFITVIGIPFGIVSLRMAGLALAPFGKQVVDRDALATMPGARVVSQA